MAMPFHTAVLLGLAFTLAACPDAFARGVRQGARTAEVWAATVVSRIAEADGRSGAGPGGRVTLRLRIAADGTLADAVTEGGSGSPDLDARALKAVSAASPFLPPPRRIVTLEGYTELGFTLDFDGKPRRDR